MTIDTKSILEAVEKNREASKKLEDEQGRLFATSLVLYMMKNPDAHFFIAGQTGEYDDEGYSGCFVVRVDPAYVKKQTSDLKPGAMHGYRAFDPKSVEKWDKKALNFAIKSQQNEDYVSLPFEVDYGPVAEVLQVNELNIFEGLSGVKDAWESLGGKYGHLWAPEAVPEMVKCMGQSYQQIKAEVEKSTLEKAVAVKTPRKREKKVL